MADFIASIPFTAADDTALETYNANFVKIGSNAGMEIKSNRAVADSNAAGAAYYYSAAQAPTADYSVWGDIIMHDPSNYTSPFILGRLPSAGGDCYGVRWNAGNWILAIFNDGTVTSITTSASEALSADVAKTVELRMVGTTISVHVGGVQVISVTDATVAAKGYAGLGHRFSDFASDTVAGVDNFKGTYTGATTTQRGTLKRTLGRALSRGLRA